MEKTDFTLAAKTKDQWGKLKMDSETYRKERILWPKSKHLSQRKLKKKWMRPESSILEDIILLCFIRN